MKNLYNAMPLLPYTFLPRCSLKKIFGVVYKHYYLWRRSWKEIYVTAVILQVLMHQKDYVFMQIWYMLDLFCCRENDMTYIYIYICILNYSAFRNFLECCKASTFNEMGRQTQKYVSVLNTIFIRTGFVLQFHDSIRHNILVCTE